MKNLLRIVVGAVAVLACSRSKEPEPAPVAPPPGPSAAAKPSTTRYERPSPSHLVAIGDLHGDFDVTRRALRLAGAIDEHDAWIGGNLVVVQTGDEIDRGDDDKKIIDLFERLKVEAPKSGGAVYALAGNHELMNASGDFRYVTPGGSAAFGNRAAAFKPGGPYATIIADRPVMLKVGESVFVHGGVLPKHVRYGIDRINDEVRDWLLGKRPDCPAIVLQEDGPVWTRMYSAAPGPEDCATLQDVLSSMGAKRMVVGHTPQRNGIGSACDDHVWRIDTGLSKYYEGKLEVLDIQGSAVTVKR